MTSPASAIARPRPAAATEVRIHDTFWTPRIAQVRDVMLPHMLDQFSKVGHLDALRGNWAGATPPHIFWDSDIGKWIEAASYLLAAGPDPELQTDIESLIDLLEAAQWDDGYLNSHFTAVTPELRFTDLRDSHELYCAGHLIEGAVAYSQATGRDRMLGVVTRYADLICATFGASPGQVRGYDGHQEIEIALIKLHRHTGQMRYLKLAEFFIEERGRAPLHFDLEVQRRGGPGHFGLGFPGTISELETEHRYFQSHLPVREQREVEGHSVRAMYFLSAVSDLALATDDAGLKAANTRLWRSVTERRMYVTGGLGSSSHNEGFTRDFDLPNLTSYAETCAAIGLIFWAERNARLDPDATYFDVAERALYNAVLGGVDASGTRFFYDNPLASTGDRVRSSWFGVACCPPNLARLVSSLGTYVYSIEGDSISVNLAVGSVLRCVIDGAPIEITQEAAGPWEGGSSLRVELPGGKPMELELRLRVPGWTEHSSFSIDGAPVNVEMLRGYAMLRRRFLGGETLRVEHSMPVRLERADPRVEDARGRVAVTRGPLVYAAEGCDNQMLLKLTGELDDVVLAAGGGETVMVSTTEHPGGPFVQLAAATIHDELVTLVPYWSWGNRGAGEMRVWIRSEESS